MNYLERMADERISHSFYSTNQKNAEIQEDFGKDELC
jgi:hypothetical protein